jgi:hypothetical protein
MWRWNLKEFIRFFQKGWNPFKIQGILQFEFVPEFITCDPEGSWSWSKKYNCSMCYKLSTRKIWWILDNEKVANSYFKVQVIENPWNYEIGMGPACQLPTPLNRQCRSRARDTMPGDSILTIYHLWHRPHASLILITTQLNSKWSSQSLLTSPREARRALLHPPLLVPALLIMASHHRATSVPSSRAKGSAMTPCTSYTED